MIIDKHYFPEQGVFAFCFKQPAYSARIYSEWLNEYH